MKWAALEPEGEPLDPEHEDAQHLVHPGPHNLVVLFDRIVQDGANEWLLAAGPQRCGGVRLVAIATLEGPGRHHHGDRPGLAVGKVEAAWLDTRRLASRAQLSSYLGDNCQSSAQAGPVGSRQLRFGADSGQCGPVGCSCGLWNDCGNDRARSAKAVAAR